MKTEMTLEQALNRLEEITEMMQGNDVSIEEALKLFEEGTKLVSFSKDKLSKATLKITELTDSMAGENDE